MQQTKAAGKPPASLISFVASPLFELDGSDSGHASGVGCVDESAREVIVPEIARGKSLDSLSSDLLCRSTRSAIITPPNEPKNAAMAPMGIEARDDHVGTVAGRDAAAQVVAILKSHLITFSPQRGNQCKGPRVIHRIEYLFLFFRM